MGNFAEALIHLANGSARPEWTLVAIASLWQAVSQCQFSLRLDKSLSLLQHPQARLVIVTRDQNGGH